MTSDPQFGPVMACAAGGTAAELLADAAIRLAPLSEATCTRCRGRSRTFPLLAGHRGAPRADVAALEDVLRRVSALADDQPAIAELDCNPVVVAPDGATIVDMRVRVHAPAPRAPIGSLQARCPAVAGDRRRSGRRGRRDAGAGEHDERLSRGEQQPLGHAAGEHAMQRAVAAGTAEQDVDDALRRTGDLVAGSPWRRTVRGFTPAGAASAAASRDRSASARGSGSPAYDSPGAASASKIDTAAPSRAASA